jgi:insulysin
MDGKIIKSPQDKSNYQLKKLNNGIESLLISDSESKLSYVAIIIGTGSFLETDILGLAHFLEHMLFLGTTKYPDNNKYFEYINAHGGITNAFTDTRKTCYYFSIEDEYLENAIDIFSRFFIDPLFKADLIDKEINSVDSEYKKNIGLHSFQIRQALKLMSNDNHPFKNFDIGSTETLQCENIREKLISFYHQYYVPTNTKLLILSKRNLDEFNNLTKYFEAIPKTNEEIIIRNFGEPFQPKRQIKIIPNNKTDTIVLFWEINYNRNYSKFKILKYIFYLLGRETTGTLTNILINNGLIENLSVAPYMNFGDYIIINMEIQLTKYGYEHSDIVLDIINNYINTLIKNGLDKNNFKLFGKCTKLNYLFEEQKDSQNKMMEIIENISMFDATLAESISLNSLICNYNPENIELYNQMISEFKLEKSIVVMSSEKCIIEGNQIDKWFQLRYMIDNFPIINKKIYNFENIYDFNTIFIPEKLIVYKNKETFNQPIKLDFPFEMWYNYEDISIPKVNIIVEITIPEIYSDIKKFVSMNILLIIIQRHLKAVLYDAKLCYTTYDINLSRDRLTINMYGFNDKIAKILNTIFEYLLTINDKNSLFTYGVGIYKNYLENHIRSSPYEAVKKLIYETLYQTNYTYNEQLKTLNYLKSSDVFNINLKNNSNIKCLVNGSITKNNCIEIGKTILKMYNSNQSIAYNPMVKNNEKSWQLRKYQTGEFNVNFRNINDKEKNVVCCVLICSNEMNIRDDIFNKYYVLNVLVSKILSDKFFHLLRTKKQLGYIVKNGYNIVGINKVRQYQRYLIQSSEYPVKDLISNINDFFIEMKKHINNITDLYLTDYIKSCINKLIERKKTIEERTEDLFIPIENETCDFNYKQKLINEFNKVTYADVKIFYEKYFISNEGRKINVTYQ